MAYNESGELSPSQSYQLGGYTFELRSNYDGDEEVTGIVARMTYNGVTKIGGIDIEGQATIESWTVEANETEATVYVKTKDQIMPVVPCAPTAQVKNNGSGQSLVTCYFTSGSGMMTFRLRNENTRSLIAASSNEGASWTTDYGGGGPITNSFTANGKTVWYMEEHPITAPAGYEVITPSTDSTAPASNIAWGMIYGSGEIGGTNIIVARFAIDIREADGGPDGDWDEPGDTGEPSYTLNVSVTGASSGSNSGTPLEPGQTGGYGNGGTGGNGGGGGAGASTVIIYEFATDKAGIVNQEATAQGPGSGGPGGKGGKGGDGCILIFY